MKKLLPTLAALLMFTLACSDDSADDTTSPGLDVADDGSDDDGPSDDSSADGSTADDSAADDSTGDGSTGDGSTADDATGDDASGDDASGDDSTGDDGTEDPPADPALDMSGDTVVVDWDAVTDTYIPDGPAPSGGTFFQIHSSNEVDGFYLNVELYPNWGQGWTGELGTFDIGCQDPAVDTGICVHFVPVSAEGINLGEDFGADGMVEIVQLDGDGYHLNVMGLTFTDGTTFEDFSMIG